MKKIDYLPWAVSAVCLAASLRFPAHFQATWIVGMVCLVPLLWSELRKPVNYVSLTFDAAGFAFQPNHDARIEARWSEVTKVCYSRMRNDFSNDMETEWHFLLTDGRWVRVQVEWPHRSRFAKAIARRLAQASPAALKQALRQRGEGRWCVSKAA